MTESFYHFMECRIRNNSSLTFERNFCYECYALYVELFSSNVVSCNCYNNPCKNITGPLMRIMFGILPQMCYFTVQYVSLMVTNFNDISCSTEQLRTRIVSVCHYIKLLFLSSILNDTCSEHNLVLEKKNSFYNFNLKFNYFYFPSTQYKEVK